MSTFKVDRTKASFITEEVKQRIIELYHNNIRFLPYINNPNKEMFWGLFKNEPINVKMAIALMFGEKMDIFAGCKVLPFEFICCRVAARCICSLYRRCKWNADLCTSSESDGISNLILYSSFAYKNDG